MERRQLQPVGLATGAGGETVLVDRDVLHAEIEKTRAVDRRNLSAAYWENRARRLQAGHEDVEVPSLHIWLEEDSFARQVVPSGSPPGWSVRPDFFLALHECLRPRAERLEPRRLSAFFARLGQL